MEKDLFENESIPNVINTTTTIPSSLELLESLTDRESRDLAKDKPSIAKLKKALENLTQEPLIIKKTVLSLKERYELAWKTVYNKLPSWRQKEIDNTRGSDTFGNRQQDKDFIQQVASIAESDPLEA